VVAFQMLYLRAMDSLRALRDEEDGQGLVEYALILALVSIALIAALNLLAVDIGEVFKKVTDAI
jgi:pilus assembly protein Flp/PilA